MNRSLQGQQRQQHDLLDRLRLLSSARLLPLVQGDSLWDRLLAAQQTID